MTQGCRGIEALQIIGGYFKCGRIYLSRRNDNHRENIARYCIRSLADLSGIIVPFFEKHGLITAKRADFEKFALAIGLMKNGKHHDLDGLKHIAKISQSMNRKKPSEFLESSETTRQALSENSR